MHQNNRSVALTGDGAKGSSGTKALHLLAKRNGAWLRARDPNATLQTEPALSPGRLDWVNSAQTGYTSLRVSPGTPGVGV